MIPSEMSDNEKAKVLRNAGWDCDDMTTFWYAPNCICGQQFDAAWQSYLLGKRCEQPLVKEPK